MKEETINTHKQNMKDWIEIILLIIFYLGSFFLLFGLMLFIKSLL